MISSRGCDGCDEYVMDFNAIPMLRVRFDEMVKFFFFFFEQRIITRSTLIKVNKKKKVVKNNT